MLFTLKKLLLVPLMVLAVALAGTPASADRATSVEGEWTYVPANVEVREYGRYVVTTGTGVGNWTGTFEGMTESEWVVVTPLDESYGMYSERMTFTGTVDGRQGTMTIVTFGHQVPGGIEPGTGGPWSGHWFVKNGTGGLDGIRGHGTWGGGPWPIPYEGRVHIH